MNRMFATNLTHIDRGTTAVSFLNLGRDSARLSKPFGFRHSPSDMLDDIVTERAAFDLGRAFHQAREIVGDAFAGDGAIQSL
jgi:hypothetical protein